MEIARILVDGDPHLSSKNRGVHNDYPKESLMYFNKITDIMSEYGCTHSVNLGDLSYGRFGTLEYRSEVEAALKRRSDLCNGNFYIIKGNHDEATYGKTEFEYYLERGMFKGSTNLQLGMCNINMVDFGKYSDTDVIIEDGKSNIVLTHGYFKFNSTQLPPYGEPLILDNFDKWFGIEYLISGHIHQEHAFEGNIIKDDRAKKCSVHYLPCLSRPDYHDDLPKVGSVDVIRVYDDKEVDVVRVEVPLLSIEESFNLAIKEDADNHRKAVHVDVSDVVNDLASFKRSFGDPEMIIMGLNGVEMKYKERAVELLRNASA